jgi:hypothetical protein
MRAVLSFVLCSFLTSGAAASEIPSDVRDLTPDHYGCRDKASGIHKVERGFSIEKSDELYTLDFLQTLRPGKLEDYLEPLGVDERIIANYFSWEMKPISFASESCIAKTFGSLYAEELLCKDAETSFEIVASYRDSRGVVKTDTYGVESAFLNLSTKVKPGLKGTVCFNPESGLKKAVHFNVKLRFKNQNGKNVEVASLAAFHPFCMIHYGHGEGGGRVYHGGCSVSGGVRYGIGVNDLIEMRSRE